MKPNLLRGAIYAKGYTASSCAAAVGISRQAFSKKLGGQSAFDVRQIQKLRQLLDLTDADVVRIFFDQLAEGSEEE